MKVKPFKRHVHIHAPAEKLWKVLFDKDIFQIWAKEFSPSTVVETDWQVGSKVVYKDDSNYGLIWKILENKPYESMVIEYTGELFQGKEDTESESAKEIIGSKEIYSIHEGGGMTHLDIEAELNERDYDVMVEAWERALVKIVALAETMY